MIAHNQHSFSPRFITLLNNNNLTTYLATQSSTVFVHVPMWLEKQQKRQRVIRDRIRTIYSYTHIQLKHSHMCNWKPYIRPTEKWFQWKWKTFELNQRVDNTGVDFTLQSLKASLMFAQLPIGSWPYTVYTNTAASPSRGYWSIIFPTLPVYQCYGLIRTVHILYLLQYIILKRQIMSKSPFKVFLRTKSEMGAAGSGAKGLIKVQKQTKKNTPEVFHWCIAWLFQLTHWGVNFE